MNISLFLLKRVATWFTNKEVFETTKLIVESLEDNDLPGIRKKAIVLERLKALFGSFTTFILSMVIDLAVTWVRVKAGKLVEKE